MWPMTHDNNRFLRSPSWDEPVDQRERREVRSRLAAKPVDVSVTTQFTWIPRSRRGWRPGSLAGVV